MRLAILWHHAEPGTHRVAWATQPQRAAVGQADVAAIADDRRRRWRAASRCGPRPPVPRDRGSRRAAPRNSRRGPPCRIAGARPAVRPALLHCVRGRRSLGGGGSRHRRCARPGSVAGDTLAGSAWAGALPVISARIASRGMSATAPCPTTRPSRSTVTRSARPAISSMRWLMYSTAMPAIAQAPTCANSALDFRRGQRGGGLVEHEHAAVARQCRGDLDQLPLPDAERADRRARIQCLETDQRQRRVARACSDARSTSPNRRGSRARNRFSATLSVSIRLSSCSTTCTPASSAARRDAGRVRLPRQRHRAAVRLSSGRRRCAPASTCRRRWRPSARAPRRRGSRDRCR